MFWEMFSEMSWDKGTEGLGICSGDETGLDASDTGLDDSDEDDLTNRDNFHCLDRTDVRRGDLTIRLPGVVFRVTPILDDLESTERSTGLRLGMAGDDSGESTSRSAIGR